MFIEEKEYNGYKFIIVDNGSLKVTFSDLGASVHSIIYDGKEMLLTPRALDDFISDNYYGKIVGRIANRVDKGLLTIDGQTYQMPLNEKGNTLHSAEEGLNRVKFSYYIDSNNYETKITFNFLSREDKQSLPGDVYFKITYSLKNNDPKLYLHLQADSNKETMIGITNHMYFSLGQPNIAHGTLQIKASEFIATRFSDLIPLYQVPIVSCLDYREEKPVLFDINNLFLQTHAAKGIDHHFCFDKVGIKEKNIVFKNGKYKLTIYTDFEGTQVYSCNYLDGIQKVYGLNDLYEGIAIEPQDSLLNRKIGTHFENLIIYEFSK